MQTLLVQLFAPRIPTAALLLIPDLINFYQTEKTLYIGEFV